MKWGAIKDEWETPPELFTKLNWEFNFDLDPCATQDNHLVKKYYSPTEEIDSAGVDGLARQWFGRVYMNPPHSCWRRWVRKARMELRKGACTTVVALLPVDTSTLAFHNYIKGRAEIRFLPKRLTYYYRGAPGPYPARFSSMVVIWRRL